MSGSDALDTAIGIFHGQLQISIKDGRASFDTQSAILSTLRHLDPLLITGSGEYGFSWLANLLHSEYPDDERYELAVRVVEFIKTQLDSNDPEYFPPDWIPPLLDFLSLGEKLYPTTSLLYPGFVALRILSSSPGYSVFGVNISPILTSILLPTHPLQSCILGLRVFYRFIEGWFSSEMKDVLSKDLDKLLQAVGDPFHFSDRALQDGKPANYKPTMAVVVLIEFASSDLLRNHLRRSNFTSYEETLSTAEGRRTALISMFDTATHSCPEFLCTPAKVNTAIKRLEELQCLNTAEAVILWAWTAGVMDLADHDGWELVERNTLKFYRTHGIGRLTTLSRHIINTTMDAMHMKFLLVHYRDPPCRLWSVRRLVSTQQAIRRLSRHNWEDLRVAQVCRLRRLYHLFGYDPTTWREAFSTGDVGEGGDTSSERPVTPVKFTDLGWGCDYP